MTEKKMEPAKLRQESKEAKKARITEWELPDSRMAKTQYGDISYAEWCKKEAERMNISKDDVRIIKDDLGYIALSR